MPKLINYHRSWAFILGCALSMLLWVGWLDGAIASPWTTAQTVLEEPKPKVTVAMVRPQEEMHQALVWGDLCVSELELGEIRQALASCDRALALDGDNATYRLNRGVALYRLGDYSAALQEADRALALNPHDYRGHYNRGLAQVALHNFEGAIQAFDQALAIARVSEPAPLADMYDDRGLAKLMATQSLAAIQDFDQALALNPRDVRARFNRGCACHQMGRLEEALADLNQVLVLEPDHAHAYLKRGLLRQALGDHSGGLADLQQAADCAQAQAQPHLHHYILTVLNEWQRPTTSVG